MLIGFTGTQSGLTNFQKAELPKHLVGCSEFIFGDCIGADKQACDIALECGIRIFTIHPPEISTKRAFCFDSNKDTLGKFDFGVWHEINGFKVRWYSLISYLKRNSNIVDQCSKLIACPKEFKHTVRSGTWATIRKAWKRQKIDKNFQLIVIPPIVRDE